MNRNHETTIWSQIEVLLFFARDLCSAAQHLVCIRESSIPRSGQAIFIASFKWPSFTIWDPVVETSISYLLWTAVRWENVSTAAPVSRFIFTHSTSLFGLLWAHRSELPSENELTDVSCVCSPSSCHPTELQSSFHSSQFHSSFQEVSMGHVCADS